MCDYYHIVPWYNSSEWHHVYELIYSPNSTLKTKEEGYNLLVIWKARCPSLPSGVESTYILLEVCLQDKRNESSLSQERLLRLAYSSAIMRFVNHMLETETAKGPSLYQAAKNVGLPEWVIDLRHDAAHSNNLPTIELLREACSISLDWLQENYWEKHKLCIEDYTTGQNVVNESVDDQQKISALLNLCISLSVCSKCKIKHLAAVPDVTMVQEILSDAKYLFGDHIGLSKLRNIAILSLINSTNLNAKKILKNDNCKLIFINLLIGKDSIFFSFELLNYMGEKSFHKKGQLSSDYVLCFEELLTFLHTNELLLDFILELIKVSQCEDNGKKKCTLAALWVSEILKALYRCREFMQKKGKVATENSKKQLKQLFYHWFPNIKTKGLILNLIKPVPVELTDINYLQPIISIYNPYLTYFIKDMLNLVKPPLPQSNADKICDFARLIACPEKYPFNPDSLSRLYTVEDLKKGSMQIQNGEDSDCIIEEPIELEKHEGKNKDVIIGIWKLASNKVNWSKCPFGKLPWHDQTTVPEPMEVEDK